MNHDDYPQDCCESNIGRPIGKLGATTGVLKAKKSSPVGDGFVEVERLIQKADHSLSALIDKIKPALSQAETAKDACSEKSPKRGTSDVVNALERTAGDIERLIMKIEYITDKVEL